MGSASFLGFSCPNPLVVLLDFLFLGTSSCFFASVGTFSEPFFFQYLILGP